MDLDKAQEVVRQFQQGKGELSDDEILDMFSKGSGTDAPIQDVSDLNGSGKDGRLKQGDTAPNGKRYHVSTYWFANRIAEGYSPIAIFVGKEGSGKSMAALRFAMNLYEIGVLDGEMTPEKVQDILCYDVAEFLINFLTHRRQAEMMDEAGKNLNSKDWNQRFNRAVDNTVQTQRILENVHIYILPVLNDLDKSIRRRPDGVFHCLGPGNVDFTGYKYKYDNFGNKDADNRISFPNYPNWHPDLPPEPLRRAYRLKEGGEKHGYLVEAIQEVVKQQIEEKEDRDTTGGGGLDQLNDLDL